MTVAEFITLLSKLPQKATERAVDARGNSTHYVLVKNLNDSIEITGLPDYSLNYFRDDGIEVDAGALLLGLTKETR